MNDYLKTEITTEVAWQVGDILGQRPRAESRWLVCNIAKRIIESGTINEDTTDIDEMIAHWLDKEEGYRDGGFR